MKATIRSRPTSPLECLVQMMHAFVPVYEAAAEVTVPPVEAVAAAVAVDGPAVAVAEFGSSFLTVKSVPVTLRVELLPVTVTVPEAVLFGNELQPAHSLPLSVQEILPPVPGEIVKSIR